MPSVIEIAKSGRASCRGCGEKIAKDVHRFGEETPNLFSEDGGVTYRWWHLSCAATKVPNELRGALGAFAGEVPDREALDRAIEEHAHPDYPYAERAPNGRAKCRVCKEAIKKDGLRVVFERAYDAGMGPVKSAGYLHPACAMQYKDAADLGKSALIDALRAHSKLDAAGLDEVAAGLLDADPKTVTQG